MWSSLAWSVRCSRLIERDQKGRERRDASNYLLIHWLSRSSLVFTWSLRSELSVVGSENREIHM